MNQTKENNQDVSETKKLVKLLSDVGRKTWLRHTYDAKFSSVLHSD